jgi:hypothetical protein
MNIYSSVLYWYCYYSALDNWWLITYTSLKERLLGLLLEY